MPRISVVIPTKNRSELLGNTIEYIESQTVPQNQYEVIVIDNDSTDDTRNLLEQKARTYRNLRYAIQEKPGAAATRNVGLRMAKADLILFVDDDVEAEQSLIQTHLDYHKKYPNASVIGSIRMPWENTTDPFLRYLRDHRILNPYSPSNGPIDFSFYHTGNVSTPTSVLLDVGGFNEDFQIYGMEDIELGYRLEKAGSQMVFAPDAKGIHYSFPGYRSFIERSEQAGYTLGQFIQMHPELKDRFVESSRIARHLKNVHSLYGWSTAVMDPVLGILTKWESTRGTGPLTRLMDVHYTWSIRYHFFLGYHRHSKEQKRAHPQRVSSVQPALAKKYRVKAKGEL